PRLREVAATVDHADEVPQHLLAGVEVGDHAVLERAQCSDGVGGAPDHPLRLVPDRHDLLGCRGDGHDGGFVDQHTTSTDVDQRVRGAEVDGHVATDEAVRHGVNPCSCWMGEERSGRSTLHHATRVG